MSGQMIERTEAHALIGDLTAGSGDTVDVIAPFTGKVLHQLPLSTAQDVADAAAAARVAQRSWWAAGFAHRRRVLLKAHDLLLERRELLLDAVQTETGKTRGQAFEEVFNAVSSTRWNALAARKVLRGSRRRGGIPLVLSARVSYSPKGIVGVITPWNYPLSLGIMDVASALAAGNGVVQKADNQGALTILASRKAFVDAGLPSALWAVVAGDGATIGNAVVDAADYVAFTGSTATGRNVAARASSRVVGASMELGGKNPLLVLADVDPQKAAAIAATACFTAAGQLCVSMERLYVHRDAAAAFVPAFAAQVSAMSIGPAFDFSTDVGSLATAAQLERVMAHIDDATTQGATVLAGGKARPDLGPYFVEPTVFTGVTESMECFQHETFGPVVAVSVVDSDEEAIALANDSNYGLNASVLSGSPAHGRQVAERLHFGSVNINEGYRAVFGSVDAPMGGVKESGLGRRNGKEGLLRYVEPRTIATATGLIQLPLTGAAWQKLSPLLVVALKALKAIRRR